MRGAGAGASSAATAVSIGPKRRVVLSDGTVQRRNMIGGLAGAKRRMAEPLREFFSADYDSALVHMGGHVKREVIRRIFEPQLAR